MEQCKNQWNLLRAGGCFTGDVKFSIDTCRMYCQALQVDKVASGAFKVHYSDRESIRQALARILTFHAVEDKLPGKTVLDIPWEATKQPKYAHLSKDGPANQFAEEFWTLHSDIQINNTAFSSLFQDTQDGASWETDSLNEFFHSAMSQRIITTHSGKLGYGIRTILEDDTIAIVRGCNIPLVLRPYQEGYKYIGPCYIDGLMFGEAVQGLALKWEEVVIM